MRHYRIFFILFILLLLFHSISYASESIYVWSNQSNKLDSISTSITPITNNDTITDNSLGLESGSACLMEQSTRTYHL